MTEYWDKTPGNHKQFTFIKLVQGEMSQVQFRFRFLIVRTSGWRKTWRRSMIVVSSLIACSLHEKMSCIHIKLFDPQKLSASWANNFLISC